MLVIGIALGVIAVALIVIIVLMSISLKKKKSSPDYFPDVLPTEKTAFAGEYTIQFSDIRHPGQKWKLPVTGEITIGREPDCTLVLTDPRVSRHHCKVSAGEHGLLITNLSETNETKLNGVRVSGDAPLRAGDVLKLGHEELRADFIKSQSGFDSYELHPQDDYIPPSPPSRTHDNTRHFF